MYRKAEISDIEKIKRIPSIDLTEEEIMKYINNDLRYLYVYENEDKDIISASFFGTDEIDDDDYDSEIYGIYTRNIKNKDVINSEVLFETKKELFDKGYRNLIVWCDEKNEKMRKFLKSSGGVESKTRENHQKIEVADPYELLDYSD